MHIEIDGNQVEGSYYYNKRGPNAKLQLSGTYKDGKMNLNETNEKGVPTGHFKGEFEDGEYKGQFIDSNGKSLNFLVTEAGVSIDEALAAFEEEEEVPDDYENLLDFDDDDDDDDDIAFDDDEGDSSIDKFLDDYEKYMDDYVKFLKKMQNNDPTALANYAKMMARYEKMALQANRLKGEMSIKQAQRLNRITTRMTEVMIE
jgi:hypothetical protein